MFDKIKRKVQQVQWKHDGEQFDKLRDLKIKRKDSEARADLRNSIRMEKSRIRTAKMSTFSPYVKKGKRILKVIDKTTKKLGSKPKKRRSSQSYRPKSSRATSININIGGASMPKRKTTRRQTKKKDNFNFL